MNGTRDLERLVADYYATLPPSPAPGPLLSAVLTAVDDTPQRHRWTDDPSSARSRIGIAALLVAAALVVAIGAIWWRAMAWQGPATPPDTPSPDGGALTWTTERLAQDWPLPVRVEPGGDPLVIEMGFPEDAHWDPAEGLFEPHGVPDSVGDLGPDGPAWIDIVEATVSSGRYLPHFGFDVAGGLPLPIPDPGEQWIAFGVVLDVDEDGVADVRIGIDNLPDGTHRAWRTDLVTGETLAKAGPPYATIGRRWEQEIDPTRYGDDWVGLDSYYPGEGEQPPDGGSLWYSIQDGEEPVRYYAWASMIEDGRVVATDYAPDAGWLSPGPQPALGLIGPTWSVESWTIGDATTPMPESETITVTAFVQFTEDGRVVTNAPCLPDLVEGNATVVDDTVTITGLERPTVLCEGMATGVDVAILDVLLAPGLVYEVQGATLDLTSAAGSLRLTAEDAPVPE